MTDAKPTPAPAPLKGPSPAPHGSDLTPIASQYWAKVDKDAHAPEVIASYVCPVCHKAHQVLSPAQSIDGTGTVVPPVAAPCGFSGAVHFLGWKP